jgi:hypothetical protein
MKITQHRFFKDLVQGPRRLDGMIFNDIIVIIPVDEISLKDRGEYNNGKEDAKEDINKQIPVCDLLWSRFDVNWF